MVTASHPNPATRLRIPAQGRLTADAADAFRDLIDQRPVTGAWTSDLEAAVARLSNTPHVIAAASANTALSLILRGIGLQPGDEVIMPAYAPVTIAEVIRSCGGVPVPVDVQSDSLHIEPLLVEAAVTSRTKAVVALGVGGIAVDAAAIQDRIGSTTGITLIENTCGVPVNPHAALPGHIRCFGTAAHAGNPLNSGALICLADDSMARQLRDLVAGVDPHSAPATLHMAEGMSELAAVWQLAGLDMLKSDWLRRCEIAMNYSAAFSSRQEISEPCEPADKRVGWVDYVLRLKLQHVAVSRDELAGRLQRRGVPAAVRWLPVHLSPVFQQRRGLQAESFPVSHNEFLRELGLPIHASLTDVETEYVIEAVLDELDSISSRASVPRAVQRV